MIDTTLPGSVGWWFLRLSQQLQRDQGRFTLLESYRAGRPPLAWGSNNVASKFYRFQQMSKTNFADVIVEAPSRRVRIRSISTAADADHLNGDPVAWALLRTNGMAVGVTELTRLAKTFGRAYIATAESPTTGGHAIMTVEDPRQVITEADPIVPNRQRAAYKAYYEPEAGCDVVILWLPGQKWVATRPRRGPLRTPRSAGILGTPEPVAVRFNQSSFDVAPVRTAGGSEADQFGFWSEQYDEQEIPVDLVLNKRAEGEFETHTDLLDRINHMIFQRVVIATMQAFRQRALKQSDSPSAPQLPEVDAAGNPIDYSDILEAGPDRVWLLPPGADLWESGQADLQGILSSVKDDVLHLAAVTSTPMSMFTPDAAAQTAEGAQLLREEMVFKVEEFEETLDAALSRAVARAFRFMGDDVRGDSSRVSVQWRPPERYSLAEMGSAASQVAGTLTWAQVQEVIWQRTPQEIEDAKSQRAEDLVLAAQQARLIAATATPRTPPPPSPSSRPPTPQVP